MQRLFFFGDEDESMHAVLACREIERHRGRERERER